MTFALTNQERPYLGLALLDPGWVPVPLQGATAWFEGDTLRKLTAPFSYSGGPGYTEKDLVLETSQQRTMTAPERAGAKPRKLTLRLVQERRALGFVFRAEFTTQGRVWIHNDRTRHELVKVPGVKDEAALRAWVSAYIASCGPGHLAEVALLATAAPPRIRARAGDLFAVPLPGGGFGHGQVVLDTNALRDRLTLARPTSLLGMGGVLVQLFRHRGAAAEASLTSLRGSGALPSFLMSTLSLRYGRYPIFGRERVRVDDLDFPAWILNWGVSSRYFSTGLVEVEVALRKPSHDAYPLPSSSGGVWAEDYERALGGDESGFQKDLRHSPDLAEVLAAAGFAPGTSYDAMCAAVGVPDRAATLALLR